jgi:diguanylate cyclase (GGDEF)-like protein
VAVNRLYFGKSASTTALLRYRQRRVLRSMAVALTAIAWVRSGRAESFTVDLIPMPQAYPSGAYAFYVLAGVALLAGVLKLRAMHINNLVNQRTAELQHEIAMRKEAEDALKAARDEAMRARDELHFLAYHDGLTGLLNRRAILEALAREAERAKRTQSCVGLILIDVDHFKKVNDTLGHAAGDWVLIEITRRICQSLRAYDSVGRYGGEEFLIVVPECDHGQVLQTAERVRLAVAESPIRASISDVRVTVSIGAGGFSALAFSATETLACVDEALYRAKGEGRNRTVLTEQRCRKSAGPAQAESAAVARTPIQ